MIPQWGYLTKPDFLSENNDLANRKNPLLGRGERYS